MTTYPAPTLYLGDEVRLTALFLRNTDATRQLRDLLTTALGGAPAAPGAGDYATDKAVKDARQDLLNAMRERLNLPPMEPGGVSVFEAIDLLLAVVDGVEHYEETGDDEPAIDAAGFFRAVQVQPEPVPAKPTPPTKPGAYYTRNHGVVLAYMYCGALTCDAADGSEGPATWPGWEWVADPSSPDPMNPTALHVPDPPAPKCGETERPGVDFDPDTTGATRVD